MEEGHGFHDPCEFMAECCYSGFVDGALGQQGWHEEKGADQGAS